MGYLQKEWLVYFYEAPDHPYQDAMKLKYMSDYEIVICPVRNQWQLLRIKDFTCVAFVMRLIGFYKWYIFTPYQLFCALRKAGYSSFYKTNGQKKEKNPSTDN